MVRALRNLVTACAIALAAAPAVVQAGLEDCKHSTALTSSNFDGFVNGKEVGSLVAFFAPWCGHCKSLAPTWDKLATAFEGDDRCAVAHVDADAATGRALGQRYGVKGFPTIRFVPPAGSGKPVVEYMNARSERALLDFMNEHCGTHREPGGGLSALAGRVPALDEIAGGYLASDDKATLLAKAKRYLANPQPNPSHILAEYYVKVMTKFADGVDDGLAWVKSESARLAKLASQKGKLAGRKFDEIRMKHNILKVFEDVKAAGKDAKAAGAAATDRVKAEL